MPPRLPLNTIRDRLLPNGMETLLGRIMPTRGRLFKAQILLLFLAGSMKRRSGTPGVLLQASASPLHSQGTGGGWRPPLPAPPHSPARRWMDWMTTSVLSSIGTGSPRRFVKMPNRYAPREPASLAPRPAIPGGSEPPARQPRRSPVLQTVSHGSRSVLLTGNGPGGCGSGHRARGGESDEQVPAHRERPDGEFHVEGEAPGTGKPDDAGPPSACSSMP
jgi:hypothetical protein